MSFFVGLWMFMVLGWLVVIAKELGEIRSALNYANGRQWPPRETQDGAS